MVLGLSKFPSRRGVPEGRGVLAALLAVSLFLGCADAERSNPYDENGSNFNPSLLGWVSSSSALVYAPSSGSVGPGYSSPVPSSSSSAPSSSSQEPSSSSLVPSSSSQEPSSSSVVPSSSSALPSSSSVASSSSSEEPSSSSTVSSSSSSPSVSSSSSYGGLCAGFDPEAEVEHYGKMKKQFCDERDGKKYVYVVIYKQIWMAENLNYNAEGSKCYDNLDSNCDKYGRLYNWATAKNNAPSSTAVPSGVRGVCPEGWHLPSQAEWDALSSYVQNNSGCNSCDATKLKTRNGWKNGSGTDDYGFSALPGGRCNPDGKFYSDDEGRWWSASALEVDDELAPNRYIGYNIHEKIDVIHWQLTNKSTLYSVRCLQD